MKKRFKRIRKAVAGFLGRHGKGLRKGAGIILAIALCCVPPVFVNNAIGYIPLLVLVLSIVLSYLYLIVLNRSLEFEEASRTAECMRGSAVDFVLRLRNRGILLFPRIEVVFHQADLFGDDMRVTSTDITLAPRATRDFTFSMRFDHVGCYQAGLKRVVLHDIIGLFSKTYENDELQTVNVLPQTHYLQDISFDAETPTASTVAQKVILNEGMDYSQVREYTWGDPLKSIHWKLSSRIPDGSYLTRIYESNTNPGLMTVIDLHAPEDLDAEDLMNAFDGVIESALSVDAFARSKGLDSELVYANEYGEEKRYTARMQYDALHDLTTSLRRDTSCFAGSTNAILSRELNSPYAQSNLAVCTSDLESGVLDLLLSIKQRRRNPILFYVIPKGLKPDERKKLTEPLRRIDGSGITYFVLSDVDEISVHEGRE